jgi:AcrR family transcriptional regulator
VSPSTRTRRPRSRRGSGDQLRGEILSVASGLLTNAENISEVSTRAVADAVGVSAMAIYHHFADKQALLDAVVAGVIAELDDVMRSASDRADDPLAALCAEVSAYVQFAMKRPMHYRYATMEQRRAGAGGNELDEILAESVQGRLGIAVAACMESGFFGRADPHMVTLAIWSAAHGIAALMIAKPDLGWGDRTAFADAAVRAVVRGYAAGPSRWLDLNPEHDQ